MIDRWSGRNQVAIVGAGVTNVCRHAEVPVGSLGLDASLAAIADAGLTPDQIDGVACGEGLPASGGVRVAREGFDTVNASFLAHHLGIEPRWTMNYSSFPPALTYAVDAILAGSADYILVNRTLHNPPGRYSTFNAPEAAGRAQWTAPYGHAGTVTEMAMAYMEYQQRFGCTRADMATLVVQLHQNVQAIPQAYWYGKELTLDDYMSARVVAEPMCLFDADIPVDGAGAVVVTSAERARDLPHPPVYVTGWVASRVRRPWPAGSVDCLDEIYDRGFDLSRRLWSQSGWRPEDARVVQIYDGFTPLALFWLEIMGFCPVGEAWRFIQDGRIDPKGDFPLLSGGGNQGWGRLHGFPHVYECYLQVAGRAGQRQTSGADTALSSFSFPNQAGARAILYSNSPDA